MAEASPKATPKRKHGPELPVTPIKFSFDPWRARPAEDGSNSPRTAVAHRFRGLEIGGGGVAADEPADGDDVVRKRPRPDDIMADGPDTAAAAEPGTASPQLPQPDVAIASTEAADDDVRLSALPAVDGPGINGVGFKPTPALAEARALKQRQKLAEYRRREENEARAQRSQWRRGGTPTATLSGGVAKKRSPTRRVCFLDTEGHKIVLTTV